jgi:uncharacterized membrane protein
MHPVIAPTIDVPIAIQTSVKAVLMNPFTMALWGLIVARSLAIGFLLVFAGLAVVVPVLAHSTWHLYRKVVEPTGGIAVERLSNSHLCVKRRNSIRPPSARSPE